MPVVIRKSYIVPGQDGYEMTLTETLDSRTVEVMVGDSVINLNQEAWEALCELKYSIRLTCGGVIEKEY